jgi:hypothetical protein
MVIILATIRFELEITGEQTFWSQVLTTDPKRLAHQLAKKT